MTARERPILMSAPMVRAILAGTKTQTRRAVKWRMVDAGLNLSFTGLRAVSDRAGLWALESDTRTSVESRCDVTPCPYGQPGDRLWVRETWQAVRGDDRARHIMEHPRPDTGWIEYAATPRADEPAYKWRPSIFMPRWACRLTLEVTGVRVERLQAISEEDALAEGCEPSGWRPTFSDPDNATGAESLSARDEYAVLWESINGAGSWDANPWVWVVEFRRLRP